MNTVSKVYLSFPNLNGGDLGYEREDVAYRSNSVRLEQEFFGRQTTPLSTRHFVYEVDIGTGTDLVN